MKPLVTVLKNEIEEKKEYKILKVMSLQWELFYETLKKYTYKIDHNEKHIFKDGS